MTPGRIPGTLAGGFGALRERQGLSQVALAKKLGVNASTVVAWERGRVRKPFPKVQRRFEEFLAAG
jgi:DNA-binding transcriptional regulator YiaG